MKNYTITILRANPESPKLISGLALIVHMHTVFYTPVIKSSEDKMNVRYITALKKNKEEKMQLIKENKLCNGTNIGLAAFGFGASLSAGIGVYFKDRVLELGGIVATTVVTGLLITTNCIQCYQNHDDEDDEYNDDDL